MTVSETRMARARDTEFMTLPDVAGHLNVRWTNDAVWLKVFEVENIELGVLTYQLRQHVPRNELEHMEALALMRNDLAHRKPIDPQKFKRALEISDTLR